MDHHGSSGRLIWVVVFFSTSILEVETLGELEVELDGGALEGTMEGVSDGDIDFGTVESPVTWVDFPFPGVFFLEGFFELLEVLMSLRKVKTGGGDKGCLLLLLCPMFRWFRGNCLDGWRARA